MSNTNSSTLTVEQQDAIKDALRTSFRLGTYLQKAPIDDLCERRRISELMIRLEKDLIAKFETSSEGSPQ